MKNKIKRHRFYKSSFAASLVQSLVKPRQRQRGPTFAERGTAERSRSQVMVLPRTVKGQAGFSWKSVHCPQRTAGTTISPSPAWWLLCELESQHFLSSSLGIPNVPLCSVSLSFYAHQVGSSVTGTSLQGCEGNL